MRNKWMRTYGAGGMALLQQLRTSALLCLICYVLHAVPWCRGVLVQVTVDPVHHQALLLQLPMCPTSSCCAVLCCALQCPVLTHTQIIVDLRRHQALLQQLPGDLNGVLCHAVPCCLCVGICVCHRSQWTLCATRPCCSSSWRLLPSWHAASAAT